MEILFCLILVAIKLIQERIAIRRAEKYADMVVRRYDEKERESKS